MSKDALMTLWLKSANITKTLDNSLGAIHGIGFVEFMVLHNLTNAPNQCMRRIDMAESVGRTASGVTRMLMPLEKIGLVGKEVNSRDARVSLVTITDAGKSLYKDAVTTVEAQSNSILGEIDKKKFDTFLTILEQL